MKRLSGVIGIDTERQANNTIELHQAAIAEATAQTHQMIKIEAHRNGHWSMHCPRPVSRNMRFLSDRKDFRQHFDVLPTV